MAFGTFTLTGKFLMYGGAPAIGRVQIDGIPQNVINVAGKDFRVGPRTVVLDSQGAFSIDLPSDSTTGNSTSIAFRATVSLKHQNLAPVEFYARPMSTTVDLSSITTQQVVALTPTGVSQADFDAYKASNPGGGSSFAITSVDATKTASATLAANRHTPVDATSAARTMTLPTTAAVGALLSVEKTDASANAVTITGTMRGVTSSIPLTSQYEARTFLSEGSGSWRPVSDHRTASSLSALFAPRSTPLVPALTYPLVIGHRGAGNLFPQSTLAGYQNAAGLPLQAIEAGDFRAVTDGGLADFHDATVDATTTATGNASSYSTAGMKRLVVDASAWFGGGWGDAEVLTLPELLGKVGGLMVLVIECKDLLDSTAAAICTRIKALGLQDAAILQSFTLSNLQVPEAAGIAKMFLTGTVTMSVTHAQIAAAGVSIVAIDHQATGDVAGWVTAAHTAGMKAIGYTIDRQSDYDAAIAKGFDGCFSNDPLYAPRNYAAYRKTATSWHLNGTWGHGMMVGGPGPFSAAQRGSFVGVPGVWRWRHAPQQIMTAGDINPVANPSGSYTVTAKFVVDQVPSNTAHGACFFIAAADDKCTNLAGNIPNSYLMKIRGSGAVNVWSINAAGASTSLGSQTATAWSIPTLSAGLTSGAAVTSLPVNALTVALKVGHQFMLPTGQIVTLTAAAAVSATSITIASVAPSSAVASGASLLPYITVVMTVSPTTVTFNRTDESGLTAITAADTTQRGGYIYPMNAIDANTGNVSFHTITIT